MLTNGKFWVGVVFGILALYSYNRYAARKAAS